MGANVDVKLTASDYRILPPGPPHYQLIDGELHMTPAPSFRHCDVVSALHGALRTHASKRKLGKIVTAPVDVHLGEQDVFQPDILFVASEDADRIRKDGVHGAPDLVVEVLSPSTRWLDLTRKRMRYATAGVVEAWYVDLDMEIILVYRLQENAAAPVRTLGRGDTLTTALLPGFEVATSAVIDAE